RTKREVHIDIQEVHRPELDATLVAESIALQLEKRVAFRRAMRKSVDSALRFGCKGIKVRVAGRLNGAEIARKEWYLQGRLPLQTLRADIDFGTAEAHTTYGVIGVKCWIYQGENVPKRNSRTQEKPFTKKPAETRMGKGKGAPEKWVAVVKPGRIMFEIAGIDEATAREALTLASHKLPIPTKFVSRAGGF